MQKDRKAVLITGGNGFIGHHMARYLKRHGHFVIVADIKAYEYGVNDYSDDDVRCDLRDPIAVDKLFSVYQWDEVYCFACQMGGAGYIFTGENDCEIMTDSALININTLRSIIKAKQNPKIFYSSSACMYPKELQTEIHEYGMSKLHYGLRECDAYPANPDSEYGWEKLFSERLYLAYARNYGLNVRIARFHNIFGEEGTYKGGKEKAPAAMCRKVAEAIPFKNSIHIKEGEFKLHPKEGAIEVWGDGKQTRSFLYIDECIEGIRRLMNSECKEPVNIGSDEMVSINELAQMAIDISGKNLRIKNVESNALGVRSRSSENYFILRQLGWKPNYPLRKGMEKTYEWINNQVNGWDKTCTLVEPNKKLINPDGSEWRPPIM